MNDEDEKMRVDFSIDWCGEKVHSLSMVFDYDETWPEILDRIVRVMESSFGYAFNITDNKGRVYGFGKVEDEDNVGC
jgi:hypothetical protein